MNVKGEPVLHTIILIGLPGSGKTSAGRLVARHFSLPFVDSDERLVEALGMSIRDYFAAHGESAFRDQEAKVLRDLLGQAGPVVLSTGGGSVLRPQNRELLKRSGTVVYLYAAPEAIYRRLRHDTKRPLLQVPNPLAKIRELADERDALYRETAHFVIHAGRTSASAVARKIIQQIQIANPGN